MSRRQDQPQKDKKPKTEKVQSKPTTKKSPEQMRKEIRAAFQAAFGHEDK